MDWNEAVGYNNNYMHNFFFQDVSEALERSWSPIDYSIFYKSGLPPFENKISNIVEILSKDFDH